MSKVSLVVTTISGGNNVLRDLQVQSRKNGVHFVIAGDKKTPLSVKDFCDEYLSIELQQKRYPELAEILPFNHYGRKNLGYLAAIENGAEWIRETDDDNFPRESFWNDAESLKVNLEEVRTADKWFNVYRCFTDEFIWPRGYPLEYLATAGNYTMEKPEQIGLQIFQGLADENPDVDAIYRMTRKLPFNFQQKYPVQLPKEVWCPFNSQNTLFPKALFPLMYLPSYCSFRMTDIWRSFVAQRCLWELGGRMVFHSATVAQDRNEHILLRDFKDEIPGYMGNAAIAELLMELPLSGNSITSMVYNCYDVLVRKGFVGEKEMPAVRAWCNYFDNNANSL